MLRWLPFIILAVKEIALGRLVCFLVDGQNPLQIRKVTVMKAHLTLARGKHISHARLSFKFANVDGSEVRIGEVGKDSSKLDHLASAIHEL